MRRAAPVRVVDRLELDAVARHAAHEFPRAAADRLLAELLLADLLDVVLRHDRAFRRHRAAQRRRQADLRPTGVDAQGQVVETSMLLMILRSVAAAEASDFGLIWRSRLNFTSCAVSLSPLWNFWPGAHVEGPGQPVIGQLPFLRHAGTDAALLDIEPDQRVVHRRLIHRIARPPLQDRVQRLRGQRLDGEDQRALLRLCLRRDGLPRGCCDQCRDGARPKNCRCPIGFSSRMRNFTSGARRRRSIAKLPRTLGSVKARLGIRNRR